MSYFLQNLINRHQEQGVSPEVSRKVLPRPKAIFETDSGPGSYAQSDLGNSKTELGVVRRYEGDKTLTGSAFRLDISENFRINGEYSQDQTETIRIYYYD